MCGIVGIANLHAPLGCDEAILKQMLAMIQHRGPDEFGMYIDDWIGLGNARLSIIDLNSGQQPICNEDQTLWIVYNGEVFNFPELRQELERQGHSFSTQTDTEVILHLYEDHGAECLQSLNGQFAFAIWNTQTRELFLARDRLGVRPLFYTHHEGRMLFASEIKSLLVHPGIPREINPDALRQVFTYWSVQSPGTVFAGVQALPAGHYMIIRDGVSQIHPYWTLDFQESHIDEQEAIEEFERLLIDATLIRLRADVPVGAYLSGGVDSSTTTAIIRAHSANRLETFSIAFSDPRFDESRHQQQMANFLGTHHHVITCKHEDIGKVYPEVIWHTETPIVRTAPAPMYLLSGLVRAHGFKVVITGEGADEFLAGYDIFKEMKIRRFWARDPASHKRARLLKKIYPDIQGINRSGDAYREAFFKQNLLEVDLPYYSHDIRWRNGGKNCRFLFETGCEEQPGYRVPLPVEFSLWSNLAQAQYLEIITFLTPYLLSSQGDRAAMGHSVEGRFPFLDYRMVEFCNHLPAILKMPALSEKWLLRQVAKKYLPAEIWTRPKRPYRAPIQHSFFNEHTEAYVHDLLSTEGIEKAGYFKPQAVQQLIQKVHNGYMLSETEEMALAGILSAQLVDHLFIQTFSNQVKQFQESKLKKIVRNLVTQGIR